MLNQEEINVAHVTFAVSITANRTGAPGNLDNVPICVGLLWFPHASSTLLEPPASWGPCVPWMCFSCGLPWLSLHRGSWLDVAEDEQRDLLSHVKPAALLRFSSLQPLFYAKRPFKQSSCRGFFSVWLQASNRDKS